MAKVAFDHKTMEEIFKDPVKWAYCFVKIRDRKTGNLVPWQARGYQAEVLRDPAIKKVLRWGRRCGKTESQIIYGLYNCMKTPGFRMIVVTPFENQIRLIFMRLFEMLEESPYIGMAVKSKTKNPYQLTFDNGSAILGFTAGTRSGQGGASLRGQRADLIYMDEADYLNDSEIETVVAIALESSDIQIILTSTPTGKRAFFYKACTNPKMGYKEFYTPSTAMPNWGPTMEDEFRAMFSQIGYQHEVLAEFGAEVTGVFNKAKVDAAIEVESYAYIPLTSQQLDYITEKKLKVNVVGPFGPGNPAPKGVRTIGVDWDKYGEVSTIIVTEYNFELNRFMPVFRSDISKSDFSLDAAVKKIIELNTTYNPQWIYCDRGFGEYQIETLRLYGTTNPESGLDKKVKGWHFSQNIELIDPVTKIMEKKPAKHFMINTLDTLFHRDKIMMSPFDELLYRQIINYNVIKISQNGAPIFTSIDEHALDAFMLSILAFALEMPDLTKTIYEPRKFLEISMQKNNPITASAKALFARVNSTVQKYRGEKQEYNDDPKTDRPPNIVRHDNSYDSRKSSSSWAGRGHSSGGTRRSSF